MTDTAIVRRRPGRPKPLEFQHLSPDQQKEYYEVTLNGAPRAAETLLGPLAGYSDTGGYAFDRYPTCLVHPDWRQFSDPDRYWFRTYNAYLAEHAAAIKNGTEALLASGLGELIDPAWQVALRYFVALRFHEAGALKVWQFAQYAAQGETISYCCVEECGSRLLSTHALNRYALDLAAALPGWNDDNADELWLNDPAYAGAREYVERELTIRDWAEAIIADGLVAGPLYYEPLLRFFCATAATNGDVSTPTLAAAFLDLGRRRRRWVNEFVRACFSVSDNHETIRGWLGTWESLAQTALEAAGPLYGQASRPALEHRAEQERARLRYLSNLEELGMTSMTGVKL